MSCLINEKSVSAFLILLWFSSGYAQTELNPGDIIRLTIPAAVYENDTTNKFAENKYIDRVPFFEFNGIFQYSSEREISLLIVNESLGFSLDSITRLEKYLGRKRNFKKGAAHGLVIGSFIGTLMLYEAGSNNHMISILAGCILFGIPSSFVGGIIGSAIKTEKWEEVPLDRFKGGFKPPGRYYPIMRFQFPLRK